MTDTGQELIEDEARPIHDRLGARTWPLSASCGPLIRRNSANSVMNGCALVTRHIAGHSELVESPGQSERAPTEADALATLRK